MKKNLLKMLLALMAFTAPLLAHADLIYYEGFNYPNGNITNNSVTINSTVYNMIWTNFSGSGLHDMLVNNGHLEVSTTGNAVTSRADDDARFLSLTNGSVYTNSVQLLYASFTIICTNLPNGAGSYFASFYNNNKGYVGRMLAFTNGTVLPNTWRLAVAGNSASTAPAGGGYPVDLALNTPYQVVEELDPVTLDAATIWVNPIDPTQTGAAATEPHYTSSDTFGFATTTPVNAFAFRQASSFGNGFWIITNLATATTFAEAATNIWSTNALPPIVVTQPASVTNFPGSSFNLSVIANGQGLGELNYQWQENGSDISNPNGNANILPFTSVDPSSGTNTYDVVVTTPFGLSVTSAVVTVAIDTTPAAPTFTTQPANISVYQGQTATFSAVVVTPGNPTFTWYSNNVVVTDGVNSSGYTSTLEIDNVTPNDAAIYKVAVTNDVFATGIVSTNAALTVKTPAAVSIGYLHTLVDPTTYQPTNTPPSIAYSVTGIVTTYTNITSGDTSSYYLQDATGGINIFVTGGSTFRPQLGDVVNFVGVLSSYTSGLELYADSTATTVYPFTSYTVLSNNIAGLPTPRSISYNFLTNKPYANTNLGGLLVQISDVHFGTNAGTMTSTTANTTVTVTNSAGQTFNLFFPDLDLDVAGQTLPTYAYTVSGVLYSQTTVTNTIVVTHFSDIVTNPIVTSTDVGISLSGPTYAFAGSNVFYTLTVTNLGASAASGVVVTDSVPAGATFVSASGSGVNTAGLVTWTVGALAANTASNVTLSVTAPLTGSITNLAGVTSTSADTNAANNVSSALITTVAPFPVAGPISAPGGIATISWNVAAGPTYSILWSTNVAGPYISIASGLTTSPYTDTVHTNLPASFYKITSP